jgi:hypothetical protein
LIRQRSYDFIAPYIRDVPTMPTSTGITLSMPRLVTVVTSESGAKAFTPLPLSTPCTSPASRVNMNVPVYEKRVRGTSLSARPRSTPHSCGALSRTERPSRPRKRPTVCRYRSGTSISARRASSRSASGRARKRLSMSRGVSGPSSQRECGSITFCGRKWAPHSSQK